MKFNLQDSPDNKDQIERPHIVWGIFPPVYWTFWAGLGLSVSILAFGYQTVTEVMAVYAMGAGCAIGAIFAKPSFEQVCGHFEAKAAGSKH